jgi:hypothetical protein
MPHWEAPMRTFPDREYFTRGDEYVYAHENTGNLLTYSVSPLQVFQSHW